MNRLRASACYLAGPMTSCDDLGTAWRQSITPELHKLGVVVLDPTDKPIEIGCENFGARQEMQQHRDAGRIEKVRDFMKVIRRVDLRCVDLASFIIVRLDGTDTMGTYEEIAVAVKEQKPVLVWLDGTLNRNNVNPWLIAQVPTEYLFESQTELLDYLAEIDSCETHPTDRRWMLFDFAKLYGDCIGR